MLISAHGWRTAFLILGVVSFAIVIPLTQFIRQSPTQMGRRPYGESSDAGGNTLADSDKGLPLAKVLKTIPFWIFGTIMLLWLFCLQAIVVHIVPHATDIGVPEIAAASILSVMAGCSVAGRVSMGFVSDKLGVRQTLNLCLILSTLALGWLFFAKGIWAFYLFAIAFGLAYGGIAPLVTLVPAELFGMKSLGVIIGTLMLYGTFGEAGGPPFAGYIYDMTGSYHTALLTMAAISGFTAVLGLLLLKYRDKGNRAVASPVR
jgi:MFS family permease